MKTWRDLRHPNVLEFIGLCEINNSTYLVAPWMEDGTAIQYLKKEPREKHDYLKLLLQVSKGVQYLHLLKPLVVHGDLKGSNILISSSGDAVIADFGLSEVIDEANDPGNSSSFYKAGSRRWQAPELVNVNTPKEARRTTASDMFAFGRVVIEVFTLEVPFANTNDLEIHSKAAAGELPARPTDPEVIARGLDRHMWRLVRNCCRVKPSQRPSVDEVVARLENTIEAGGADGYAGFLVSVRRFFTVRFRGFSFA